MMNTNASLQERQHHGDLRKLLIISRKRLNSILENLLDTVAFIILIKIAILQAHRIGFTLALTEREHDTGVESLAHDQRD